MTWQSNRTMTPAQLKAALKKLGLSQLAGATWLGLSPRTMRRMISGEVEVHTAIVLLLQLMILTKTRPQI
jgi:lambda repressor-like predicted transcriptional regulator